MKGFRKARPGEALSHLPLPIAIVTVKRGDAINGMSAAWVSQVSIKPPMLMVSIHPKRYTWELLESAEHFGVSVLGEGQEEVAKVFGTLSGRDIDKFERLGIAPESGVEGTPIVSGSVAAMVCRKAGVHEAGDHLIVVGEVVEAWKGEGDRPLTWFKSKMKVLKD